MKISRFLLYGGPQPPNSGCMCFVRSGECCPLFAFVLGIHLNLSLAFAFTIGIFNTLRWMRRTNAKVECEELNAKGECKEYLSPMHKTSSKPWIWRLWSTILLHGWTASSLSWWDIRSVMCKSKSGFGFKSGFKTFWSGFRFGFRPQKAELIRNQWDLDSRK